MLQAYTFTTLNFSSVFYLHKRFSVKQGLCTASSMQLHAGVLFVLELLSCLFIMTS